MPSLEKGTLKLFVVDVCMETAKCISHECIGEVQEKERQSQGSERKVVPLRLAMGDRVLCNIGCIFSVALS